MDYNEVSFRRTNHNLSRPPFIVDHEHYSIDTGRQIAFELLTSQYLQGAFAVTVTGARAAGATDVPVTALTEKLLKGHVIDFGGGKFARLSADAPAGAETLAVDALPTALAGNEVAYTGGTAGRFFVPAGEEMDLLADGRIVPSAIGTAGVTCFCLLATAANNARSDAASGYGIITQASIYENMLPRATGTPKVLNATHKTELLARGGAWLFFQYSDNT